jgi:hypothetical protein
MPQSVQNAFSPSDYRVSTAANGATLPTTPASSPTNLGLSASWYDIGYLSDAGISEAHTYNETKVFDMVGTLLRVLRNQEERTWTFECVENDAVVHGLMYPGSTVSTSGGTSEVQTITISGTPTAGTFPVALPGYGTYQAAYNVTASALQAALQALWDIPVTVALASNVYTLTFPTADGNVPQIQTNGLSLTGGTSPNAVAATTTPGVQGVNTRYIGKGTARNLRYFCIDLFDGAVSERYLMTQGEAVWTGNVTYSGSALKIAQFSLSALYDNSLGPNGRLLREDRQQPGAGPGVRVATIRAAVWLERPAAALRSTSRAPTGIPIERTAPCPHPARTAPAKKAPAKKVAAKKPAEPAIEPTQAEAAAAEAIGLDHDLEFEFRGETFTVPGGVRSSWRVAMATGSALQMIVELIDPEDRPRLIEVGKRGESFAELADEFFGAYNKASGQGNS